MLRLATACRPSIFGPGAAVRSGVVGTKGILSNIAAIPLVHKKVMPCFPPAVVCLASSGLVFFLNLEGIA